MALVKTKALVIREQPFQDTDKILTLFTEREGKIKAIAKGVRRRRSTMTAAAQLFAYGEYVYYPGKNFGNINQADIIESYYNLRSDMAKMSLASYLLELIDNLFELYQGNAAVLKLLVHMLYYVAENKAKSDEALAAAFQIKLSAVHGILPRLDRCGKCGKNSDLNYFSIEDGGVICSRCYGKLGYTYGLDARILKTMVDLFNAPAAEIKKTDYNAEQIRKIMDMMDHYLGYNLGKSMQSYGFYKEIKYQEKPEN